MSSGEGPLPLSDFDFDYPDELVAAEPVEPRDSSRLLAVPRGPGEPRHLHFRDLPELLSPGDCLVLNETRVLFCRLSGKKSTGGKAELLLVREVERGLWAALSSGLRPGMRLSFPRGLEAAVEGLSPEGEYLCRFTPPEVAAHLEQHGEAPLPPYIAKRKKPGPRDRSRYQTVFARESGSIAAPTAGLHFTPELLSRLEERGARLARLTLHVGKGTFLPVKAADAREHRMLPERYRLPPEAAETIREARARGRRVVAVGTTCTRALETLGLRPEGFGPGEGESELFIRPGHEFRVATGLLTNFHLPRSTPLLLAAAFLGRERLLAAYAEAFRERYRLFSYGDAMLIL